MSRRKRGEVEEEELQALPSEGEDEEEEYVAILPALPA